MKQFKDISVGEIFYFNGLKYTKVTEERISCCKAINAVALDNQANRVYVKPTDEVEEVTNV